MRLASAVAGKIRNMSISVKLFAAFGVLSAAFLVLAVETETSLLRMENNLEDARRLGTVVKNGVVPLVRQLGEIQRAIIQVQQFLTDISATRGRDGLDSGFDEAAENAERFHAAMAEARKIAADLGLDSLLERLDAVDAAFPPFYEMGQKMARAYIAEGPAGGNRLMGEFDATAAKLDEAVGALIAEGNRYSDARIAALSTRLDEAVDLGRARSRLTLIISALGLLVALLCAGFLRANIAKPVADVTAALESVIGGDQQARIPYQDRGDEVGTMARAIQRFREVLAEQAELEAARAREEAARREQEARLEQERREAELRRQQEEARAREEARRRRREELLALAAQFESSVKAVAEQVASASMQVRGAAKNMVDRTEKMSAVADTTHQATEQAANNVTVVAAAAEELTYAINNILERVKDSARVADESTRKAEQANLRITWLADAAQKIGEVVELINDIAAQTNLLALNATIEAARAGEAGKGFAVVAGEVKSLAAQTAKATDEIAAQISAIQEATREAVVGIQEVTRAIKELNEIAGAISASVEEQSAATRDISQNTQHASQGTQEVMQGISTVKSAADESGSQAREVLDAADSLTREAERLRHEVDQFLHRVRSEEAA
ncbi:MAG: methyl-accepting chemotaxis protein [Rhodothalassiaceae bacterium]|nr:MAG: methyl-accepting chemotaxis protein [Rhodothalassiaceae bacterium]